MVQLRAMLLMALATYVASNLALVGLLFACKALAPALFEPTPAAAFVLAGVE